MTFERDYAPNDHAAITAALAPHDPRHPIAVAVALRLGIDMLKPTTVLDEIVVDLFRRSLESVPGAPRLVVWETLKQ